MFCDFYLANFSSIVTIFSCSVILSATPTTAPHLEHCKTLYLLEEPPNGVISLVSNEVPSHFGQEEEAMILISLKG